MAKNSVTVADTKTTELATTDLTNFEAFAGMGMEEVRREDVATAFLRILQPLSPECNKRDGKYITGAEAGSILNNGLNTVYNGEAGIEFIPCYFVVRFLEWTPRDQGGGLQGNYSIEEAAGIHTTVDDRKNRVMDNGNYLTETAHYYGLVLDDGMPLRAVLPMSSSQLTKSRKWMNLIENQYAVGSKGRFRLPIFANSYLLKTVQQSNEKGDWFGWDIKLERKLDRPEDRELVQGAMDYLADIKKGAVSVRQQDYEAANSGAATDTGGQPGPNPRDAARDPRDGVPF